MASLRIVFAYLSLTLISLVLFIIFVGVFLRTCFRSPKRPHRPSQRGRKKSAYGGADERPAYEPPPEEAVDPEAQNLLHKGVGEQKS